MATGVTAWHPKHFLQCLSTTQFMFGHHTLLQRRSFVFTNPWCSSWANCRTRLRKLTGMTKPIPLITHLPTTVISACNNLVGLGAADQSAVFHQRWESISSSSSAVSLSISLVVVARGVALTATILKYSSVTPSWGEAGIFVKRLRQSAMFWSEGTWCTVYLKGIRHRISQLWPMV